MLRKPLRVKMSSLCTANQYFGANPMYSSCRATINKRHSSPNRRELGIDAVLLGGDGWPSDQLFVMAKEALQGAYFVNHLDVNYPTFAELNTKFETKFNIPLDLNGFMAHDAYVTLVAAIEKAGSDDSEAIADALTEVTVQGVTGTIKLSKEDHNPIGKEGSITKIVGDGYEFVMKYGLGQ